MKNLMKFFIAGSVALLSISAYPITIQSQCANKATLQVTLQPDWKNGCVAYARTVHLAPNETWQKNYPNCNFTVTYFTSNGTYPNADTLYLITDGQACSLKPSPGMSHPGTVKK